MRLETVVIQFVFFLIWRLTVGRLTPKFAHRLKKLISKLIKLVTDPVKRIINRSKNKQRARRIGKYSKKEMEKLRRNFRS